MNDINTRTEELENIFLLLAAFEDNLVQYMKIKNQIIEVTKALAENTNICIGTMIQPLREFFNYFHTFTD